MATKKYLNMKGSEDKLNETNRISINVVKAGLGGNILLLTSTPLHPNMYTEVARFKMSTKLGKYSMASSCLLLYGCLVPHVLQFLHDL